MIGVTLFGLAGVLRLELAGGGSPVLPVALLIVGSNGIIAILLPYTAESFPLRVRGRATGWVAACTKAGGVAAQALSITALVPAMGVAAGADHGADSARARPVRLVRARDARARPATARRGYARLGLVRPLDRVERRREIGDQIVGILDPDRDAHEIVGDAQRLLALVGHRQMRHRRGCRRQRLGAAQADTASLAILSVSRNANASFSPPLR